MINTSARLKLFENRKQKDLFKGLEKTISEQLDKELKALDNTDKNEFAIGIVKYIVKRQDLQTLLLVQLHRDLKQIYAKLK